MSSTVRILVCDPIHPDGVELLKNEGFSVDLRPGISHEELREAVGGYDALIVRGRTKVNREILEAGRRLKVVGRAGVGLDNIDLGAAKEMGITVLNTPEASTEAVAELVVGLMLSLARRIPYADTAMKEGRWAKKELMGWELRGKTLGIIGFGRIGRRVSEVAYALGMRILTYDVIELPAEALRKVEARQVPLEEVLRESDVITLHVPLLPQTYHMIDEEKISMMKDGAYIVNASRGGVIDEKALLKALRDGKLAGAALDVYEVEPPTNLELIRMPNVVCTPHIGAQTEEAQRQASVQIAQKIIRELKK